MNASAFSLLVFSSPSPTFSSLLLIVYLFGHVFLLLLPLALLAHQVSPPMPLYKTWFSFYFIRLFVYSTEFFWNLMMTKGCGCGGKVVKRCGFLAVELSQLCLYFYFWLSVKMKLFTSPSAFPMNGIFICFASSINNLEMWRDRFWAQAVFYGSLIIITVKYTTCATYHIYTSVSSFPSATSTKTFNRVHAEHR